MFFLQGLEAADARFSLWVKWYPKMLQLNPVSLLFKYDPGNEAEGQISVFKHQNS